MDTNTMNRLRPIGFTPAIAQAIAALDDASGEPMRLIEVHRETVCVTDGVDEHTVRPLPQLQRPLDAADALTVGDWVLVERDKHGDRWLKQRVPPLTQLIRRNSSGARQPLVSNVDTAMLTMGLDGDFNLRRLERYLAMTKPAGIWPIVVLTKKDLCHDVDVRLDALHARLPRYLPVHTVDARAACTASELAPYLGAGQTIVALGSSGAGKSTLTNTLIGAHVQVTAAVREDDSRGRHTTTSRSLHRLPAGGCIIDTPGLRGLRPDVGEEDLAASFDDIRELADQCRFRNCRHHDEPDCAVREGVAADRLSNYQKMLREIRRDALTPLQRRELLATWKARHRAAAERMKIKRG